MDLLRAKLACSPMGARLYCGGGGGGGDGGAAERKRAEDARQTNAVAKLNSAFGIKSEGAAPVASQQSRGRSRADMFTPVAAAVPSAPGYVADDALIETRRADRERLYDTIASDSRALQLDDLGKERQMAQRDVNFDLARRGLFGGSRQIDTGREIEDQFSRGVLDVENNAQSVSDGARMADEKARVSLINSIRAGMSDADATSAAFNALENNARQAATDARNQNVTGFFDSIRGAANQYQQASAQERAFQKYRTGGGSGGGNYGGVVRSTE